MLDALKAKKEELARKAREVAKAAEEEFERIKLSEEQRNERLSICQSCEHLFKPTTTCKRCGCFMKVKTYLPGSECPAGKWKKIEIVKTIRSSE